MILPTLASGMTFRLPVKNALQRDINNLIFFFNLRRQEYWNLYLNHLQFY